MEDQSQKEAAATSRRAILKAAAAAGVGAAAFSAPGVSVLPAHGFTNSVVTDVCFYVRFELSSGGRWSDDPLDTNATTIAGDELDRTYTWTNFDGKGNDLVINFNGSAAVGAAGATISATTPGTCTLVASNLGTPRDVAPTGCAVAGDIVNGTYSPTAASGLNDHAYLTFDLTGC